MQYDTGVKFIPQTKVMDTYQGIWDWKDQEYKSFPNKYEAQGYLNRLFNKEVETRILRIITEKV